MHEIVGSSNACWYPAVGFVFTAGVQCNANLENSTYVNKFKLHKLLTFLRFKRHSMSVYFFLHLFWEKFELTFARLQRYDFMT